MKKRYFLLYLFVGVAAMLPAQQTWVSLQSGGVYFALPEGFVKIDTPGLTAYAYHGIGNYSVMIKPVDSEAMIYDVGALKGFYDQVWRSAILEHHAQSRRADFLEKSGLWYFEAEAETAAGSTPAEWFTDQYLFLNDTMYIFRINNLMPLDSIDLFNNRTFLHNIHVRPGLPEYRQTGSAQPVAYRLGRALLFGVFVVLLFLAFLKYRKVF